MRGGMGSGNGDHKNGHIKFLVENISIPTTKSAQRSEFFICHFDFGDMWVVQCQ